MRRVESVSGVSPAHNRFKKNPAPNNKSTNRQNPANDKAKKDKLFNEYLEAAMRKRQQEEGCTYSKRV